MIESPHFEVDMLQLRKVLRTIREAYKTNFGFCEDNHRDHLPQYNLPQGIEHEPMQQDLAKPYEGALFSWGKTSVG